MPSRTLKMHKYWIWVYYGKKDATEEEKKVAKEFLDADKAKGLFQHLTEKDGEDLTKEEKAKLLKKKKRVTDWK